jgi:hypothetical protein
LLDNFAREQGAITYQDKLFSDIRARYSDNLASPINDVNLFDPLSDPENKYGETLFAREINQLLDGGYTFSDDGQYMLPPGR